MIDETLSREAQTQTKRQQIIHTAHTLFIQQGYHGTSMRQIAQKAEIALGGLYNHFDGKEQIFEAVFLEYHPYREFLPALLQAEGEDIETFFRHAIDLVAQSLARRPDFFNLMFIELVEFSGKHTQRLFGILYPQAAPVFEKINALGAGRLRPIPSVLLARTFIGNMMAYYLSEMLFAAGAPPEFSQSALRQVTEIYLHGILID